LLKRLNRICKLAATPRDYFETDNLRNSRPNGDRGDPKQKWLVVH